MTHHAATTPWSQTPEGLSLRVYLQPRAARNHVVGLHGDAIKISLTAPPIEGRANTALVVFLSHLFKLPRSAVALESGTKSRGKRVRITTPDPTTVIHQLEQHLSQS